LSKKESSRYVHTEKWCCAFRKLISSDITDGGASFLQAIWPYSGHYMPTEENFREFIRYLEENGVDLTHVKVNVSTKSTSIYMPHVCAFARE